MPPPGSEDPEPSKPHTSNVHELENAATGGPSTPVSRLIVNESDRAAPLVRSNDALSCPLSALTSRKPHAFDADHEAKYGASGSVVRGVSWSSPPVPTVANTVPPCVMVPSESRMQEADEVFGLITGHDADVASCLVRAYMWTCPESTRSTFFDTSRLFRSGPELQLAEVMARHGSCIPTTTQGMFAECAESMALAVHV